MKSTQMQFSRTAEKQVVVVNNKELEINEVRIVNSLVISSKKFNGK